MNSQYSSQTKSEVIEELEQLLELGEASAERIDMLIEALDTTRLRAYSSLALVYVAGAGTIAAAYFFDKSSLGLPTQLISVLVILGSAVGGGFSAKTLYTFLRRLPKLRRELMVERDVHQRLMSMIDDQTQRVVGSDWVKPIFRATLEIRTRRMHRSAK